MAASLPSQGKTFGSLWDIKGGMLLGVGGRPVSQPAHQGVMGKTPKWAPISDDRKAQHESSRGVFPCLTLRTVSLTASRSPLCSAISCLPNTEVALNPSDPLFLFF